MAIYENLPVFKATYDFLLHTFNLGQHFQRDIRFTLGEELKKEIVNLLVLIYRANMSPDKLSYLSQARETMVVIKLHYRLLFDLKQISMKQYAVCCEMSETISKQVVAWSKYKTKPKS